MVVETKRILSRNFDLNAPRPCSYDDYVRNGGYEGLKAALAKAPLEVQKIVTESGLRGRGGAGFSTGLKWSFVPMDFEGTKYLICNCDEMEPGTFKDRALVYGDPHQVIEGMLIAAYAMQMDRGFIFIRYAYKKGSSILDAAIRDAAAHGWIGEKIGGTNWGFHLETHLSAGRYMCGEETALLNSLEGKRANPRSKPPFPQVKGFLGQPTIVNNVETLSNLPHILANGPEWFKSLAISGMAAGTKLMGASGRVKNPGLWELPMGTPLRDVVEHYAEGPSRGIPFKAFIPGGLSTPFLMPDQMDTPLDFDAVAKAGSRLGTAGIIVFDDRDCMVECSANIMQFYKRESCGFCTPCREGIPWVQETIHAIEDGRGEPEDMGVLDDVCWDLAYTFCAFAPGAQGPLESALTKFRGEFTEHITQHGCPLKVPAHA